MIDDALHTGYVKGNTAILQIHLYVFFITLKFIGFRQLRLLPFPPFEIVMHTQEQIMKIAMQGILLQRFR